MDFKKDQMGFSLVEVILAVAVFSILVSSLVGAFIFSQESLVLAGRQAQGLFLAEEGLEATHSLRDGAFANLTNGNHGLAATGSWLFSGTSDTISAYNRQIGINSVVPDYKIVTSTISWQQTTQRGGKMELTTLLTNWQAVGVASDCNTYCQILGTYSGGICRKNKPGCLAGETYSSGGDVYCSGSTKRCCCASL